MPHEIGHSQQDLIIEQNRQREAERRAAGNNAGIVPGDPSLTYFFDPRTGRFQLVQAESIRTPGINDFSSSSGFPTPQPIVVSTTTAAPTTSGATGGTKEPPPPPSIPPPVEQPRPALPTATPAALRARRTRRADRRFGGGTLGSQDPLTVGGVDLNPLTVRR